MTFLFYIILAIAVTVLQTSVFPHFAILRGMYDLMLPMVICIALYRPMRYNFLFVLAVAYLADSLSGGPLGLCLTTYVWVYIILIWATNYLQIQGGFLVLFVVPAGVLFQSLVSFGVLMMLLPGRALPDHALQTTFVEILWALCTGPIMLSMCHRGSAIWNQWVGDLFVDRSSELG